VISDQTVSCATFALALSRCPSDDNQLLAQQADLQTLLSLLIKRFTTRHRWRQTTWLK